jgi:hypothetical protein
MNNDDTRDDVFAFAPDADDSIECEFNTQELKTWMGKGYPTLVHNVDWASGYDPYNTAEMRARALQKE